MQEGIEMNATTKFEDSRLSEKALLSTQDLMQCCSCGRATANKIGDAAGAKITIGRRVLWNAEKVRIYLAQISG